MDKVKLPNIFTGPKRVIDKQVYFEDLVYLRKKDHDDYVNYYKRGGHFRDELESLLRKET